MNRKHLLTGIFASTGMLILILDSKTALAGAQDGIYLCIRTVIPSLFPFFLLSSVLMDSFSGTSLPLIKPLSAFCGIPKGAESILLAGFLGGYPVGAQSVASAFRSGQLRKEDAQRMLCFCNNVGPAFLFGMVAQMFPSKTTALLLWLIHVASALLVSKLIPVSDEVSSSLPIPQKKTVENRIYTAIICLATVCGWVVIFRIVIGFLDRWFLFLIPETIQVLCSGFLELSNGCCELSRIPDPDLRFILCSGMLAWGGLCVMLQTRSVTQGLAFNYCLKGKILQTALSLLLSTSIILDIWLPVSGLLLFLSMLIHKVQKRSSNPVMIGV